jgi:diguanylate cyclase (GGDEF)-like protein/PAS domain S-box-containing protein
VNQSPSDKTITDIPPVIGKALASWKVVFELLVFAIVYWITVQLGLLLAARPEGIAAVWPVSGLALAVLLIKPKNRWPILLIIIFITNAFGNWSGGNSPLVSLGYAIVNTIEPALGARVILHYCRPKITFETTREIVVLFLVGAVVNALTALLGALVSYTAFHSSFLNAWYIWWASDGLGIILITPFIIGWTTKYKAVPSMLLRQIVETSILVVIIAVFTWLLYGPFTIAEKPLLRNYMLFPLLIWFAFLLGPRGVARVLLLIAVIATWNTLHGYGIFSFASQNQAEHLVSLQIFLAVETFSALILSTIITERRKSEAQTITALKALRDSEGKYLKIFDESPIGIFQSTPQGQFALVNPAMVKIYGYDTPTEMIANITDISKQIYVNPTDRLEFQHSLVENGNLFEYIGKNYRKDKSIIWTRTTARVVKDTLGNVQFYEGYITDITERVQAEAVLNESEKLFRVIFEKSSIGYTLTSIEGEYLQVNQSFAKMLGYTVDELVGKNWADITVPEYITPNRNILKPILSGQQSSATYEKRFFCKDGSLLEAFISTTLLRDEQKTPRFFITNVIDITERKHVELQRAAAVEALRVSEQQFKLVSELTSDYIYKIGVSTEGKVSLDFVTDSYYAATGRDIEKTRTVESWSEIFHPEDKEHALIFLQNIIATHEPGKLECRTFRADKEMRWIEIVARPEWDAIENRVISIIGAVKDITDRKQSEIKLQYLSLHDALTGLNNRAFFEESMEHIEHGRQYPISVLMVDVDRLKDTNDQFGHEAGDKLLKRAANVLVTAFRVEDVIARIGGDEFAVLLLGTSHSEAEAALTRIRTILDELNATSEEPELQLSCGLSTAEQGDSLIETLKAADAKMYQEKQRRNIEPK